MNSCIAVSRMERGKTKGSGAFGRGCHSGAGFARTALHSAREARSVRLPACGTVISCIHFWFYTRFSVALVSSNVHVHRPCMLSTERQFLHLV